MNRDMMKYMVALAGHEGKMTETKLMREVSGKREPEVDERIEMREDLETLETQGYLYTEDLPFPPDTRMVRMTEGGKKATETTVRAGVYQHIEEVISSRSA